MNSIDVTHMVEDADEMPNLSGSIAELGKNAGPFTWANSVAYGRAHPLLKSDDERASVRHHFKGYGAWSEEEIAAWSDEHLEGMLCQDIASSIRERERFASDEEFQDASEEGSVSGRLGLGDDGHWYFYLGD